MTPGNAISSATAATLIATIIILILVGTYAAINFGSGASETSITCSESTATFSVIQNSTTADLNFPIPAEPCEHQISLSGFNLTTAGDAPNSLSGNIKVDSRSPLTGFILYVNGTYELFNAMVPSHATTYSIQYNAVLSNATLPIIAGMSYSIEFVALFKDKTATTATTLVNATV